MITLQGDRNPLGEMFGAAVNTYATKKAGDWEQQKTNEEIKKAFANLNEDSSPFDVMQAIESIKDDKAKNRLTAGFKDIGATKRERIKQGQVAERRKQLVTKYGLTPDYEELTESEIITAGKQKLAEEKVSKKTQETETQKAKLLEIAKKNGVEIDPIDIEGLTPAQAKAHIKQKETEEANYKSNLAQGKEEGLSEEEMRAMKPEILQKVLDRKEKAREYEGASKLAIHKSSEDEAKLVSESYQNGKRVKQAYKIASNAIEQNGVDGIPTLAKYLKVFGANRLSEVLMSKDQAQLQSLIPTFMENFKQLFGGRITNADLVILEAKVPDMLKSKEANKAVLEILNKYADINIETGDIAREVVKDNGGYRPIDFMDQIEERLLARHPELTEEQIAEEKNLPKIIITSDGKKRKIPGDWTKEDIEQAIKENPGTRVE